MHVSAIGDDDIAFGKGRSIEALAALLIGQLDEAKALDREIEA